MSTKLRLICIVILVVLGALTFLAGTDINHNKEENLMLEWLVVGLFYYSVLAYLFLDIFLLIKNKIINKE